MSALLSSSTETLMPRETSSLKAARPSPFSFQASFSDSAWILMKAPSASALLRLLDEQGGAFVFSGFSQV